MPGEPNKLSQFWQELKRRKVVRVITVYAAAAFVILQLVEILHPSLRLPEWTMNFILVLLIAGFIIAVILSWIYDIHPEGGVVQTEPSEKVKAEDSPKSSRGWKIASYISFVVIVGLIVLNVIPRAKRAEVFADLETSIAVLPFENMSLNEEDYYIGGAFTDEIIMELQKIKAFDRVLSRTSTMQFENDRPAIPEIAEKLNVNYIVEGSIQRSHQNVRVRVQVIRAKNEDHIWGEEYDREWKDIFSIQDEIAFQVAHELQKTLSPEEKDLIKKVPTTNLTAYDFYQRGRDVQFHYNLDRDDKASLEKAEEYFHKALEIDPAYAKAYTGLAMVYWDMHLIESYFSEDFMDSVLILTDIAITYDDQLAEAYAIRGWYYRQIGKPEQALKEFDKAIGLNPNDWTSYQIKGNLFSDDMVKTIENRQKAVTLNRGPQLPRLLKNLGDAYRYVGITEKASYYYQEAFKLDGDSTTYYTSLYMDSTSYLEDIEYRKKIYAFDSTAYDALYYIGYIYIFLGQYEESLDYFMRWIEKDKVQGVHTLRASGHRIGYVYWQNGYKEEAELYFDQQLEYCNRAIELGRSYAQSTLFAYYDLAAVYAFRGEKEKAYENLRIFNQIKIAPQWMVTLINDDPLFNNIRDEPEFQQIVRDVEAKYLAEHERVRQWLEENGML